MITIDIEAIRKRNEECRDAFEDEQSAVVTARTDEIMQRVADIDALLAELERVTTCDCGKPRALGVCTGNCDNDE